MHAIILAVTCGLVGLDHGWRPVPGGGLEYIVQIAPHELDVFKMDKEITADIDVRLRDIRSLRIVLGNYILPREDPPKPPAAPAAPPGYPPGDYDRQSSSLWAFLRGKSLLWEPYDYRSGSAAEGQAKRPGPRQAAAEGPAKRPAPQQTAVTSPSERKIDQQDKKGHAAASTAKEPPKRGWLFPATVVLLFGSLGGNFYLGWITWETRAQYRALLHRRARPDRRHKEHFDEPEPDQPEPDQPEPDGP